LLVNRFLWNIFTLLNFSPQTLKTYSDKGNHPYSICKFNIYFGIIVARELSKFSTTVHSKKYTLKSKQNFYFNHPKDLHDLNIR
jgi:hypothetical protein